MTDPILSYALAKDSLRKYLELLSKTHLFNLQWARLFYIYGAGQHPRSLLNQLEDAIAMGSDRFPMSNGEQLRDFLSVEKATEKLVHLVSRPDITGTVNICSGIPVSVRRFVEDRLAERDSHLALDLGAYPYIDYEPMAFWGHSDKMVGFA